MHRREGRKINDKKIMNNKKSSNNKIVGILLVLMGCFVGLSCACYASAATLSTAYDRLNNLTYNQASGTVHNIVFTPATAVSGSTTNILEFQFPIDSQDGGAWCRTAGSASEAVDTENGATGLPGTLTSGGLCIKGNGTTIADTLLVCSAGSPTWAAGTAYGVTFSGNVGVLGTASSAGTAIVSLSTGSAATCTSTFTTIDSGSIALTTLTSNQVSVSATVPPLLSFSIGSTTMGFGTLTTANVYYANTGSSAQTSEPSAGNMTQVSISTNAPNGVIISAASTGNGSTAGLYKSIAPTKLITATTANAVTAGSEGYGLFVDNLSNLTAASGFGSGKSGGTTAITNAAQTILSASGVLGSGTANVDLVAAIATTTPAGAYTDTITLTGTGKF